MEYQSEAERLADALEADQQGIDLGAEGMGWGPSATTRTRAAAELRRLYAVNAELMQALEKIEGFTMSQFRSHADLANACQEYAYAALENARRNI